jgi:hypothetical protein
MRKFYWIDDRVEKFDAVKALLEKPPGFARKQAHCEFFDASVGEDLLVLISGWATKPKPSLLIIDHVFNKTRMRNPFRIAGSTVAHILRRTWSDVPMVCVTAMLKDTRARKRHSDRESEAQYLELFQYETLADELPKLYAIARDFRKVVRAKLGKGGRGVAKLLGVPASDRQVFLANLPLEFREPADPSTPHQLSRWIIQTLLKYPGFLYSELRAATFLGLSVEGFRKVRPCFDEALYRGPFATETQPFWWVAPLRGLLYRQLPTDASSLSWVAGRQLSGIVASDYSVCYVNHHAGDIPDTVASLYPRGTEHAVCSKYTQPHPEASTPPGFEELKVIAET